jgi:hypothetical protein
MWMHNRDSGPDLTHHQPLAAMFTFKLAANKAHLGLDAGFALGTRE